MTDKPRKPWIAALLTILTRGLGHLYAGYPKRGLILFFIEKVLTVGLRGLLVILPGIITLLIAVIGSLSFTLFCIIDAALMAKRNSIGYELKKYNRWFVYAGYYVVFYLLITSLVAVGVKEILIHSYKIPSGAMIPTLVVGDNLLADKFIYKTSEPKRGDIVIFPYPENPDHEFIKRIIAVAGDVVEIRDKKVYINGAGQSEPYVIHTPEVNGMGPRDNFGPVTVPPGKLFVMGDNRDQSYDSRFFGFVPSDTVRGKAIILYWSWDAERSTVRWDRIGRHLE